MSLHRDEAPYVWDLFEGRETEFMAFGLVLGFYPWGLMKIIHWERQAEAARRLQQARRQRERRADAVKLLYDKYRAGYPALGPIDCERCVARDLGLTIEAVGFALEDAKWLEEERAS